MECLIDKNIIVGYAICTMLIHEIYNVIGKRYYTILSLLGSSYSSIRAIVKRRPELAHT
jgi:hypothetical protein